MKRIIATVALCLSTALLLTSCGSPTFKSVAASICSNSAKGAVKLYNGATTPTGRGIAEKAVNGAILAGESLAGLLSNNKSGLASNIHNTLVDLRKRQTLSNATGKGVNYLASQKKSVDALLTKLGSLCVQATKN